MADTDVEKLVDQARRCLESGLTVMARRQMGQASYELGWNRR